jgi:hypothetical protein
VETGLGKIFGPEREEIIGGRRKLYNDELHTVCCLPIIS